MKTLCIYHSDCIDGAAAAAVVVKKYPDIELIPAKHGDPAPQNLEGKRVVIVDFSFSVETLTEMRSKAAEFLWFDHHKTALPACQALGAGVIDLNESGATLTWKQLFPNTPVPQILQYVRDKDIWLWELPESREVSADIRETDDIYNPANPIWKKFLDGISTEEFQAMVARGKHSRRLLKDRLIGAGKRGFPITLDGHKGFAVNWTGDSSELGEYIYQELKYPVAAIFSYDGKQWSFSLRSNTVDVSEIAVKRGGGGHAGAAGFRKETNDILWLFETKT